MFVLLLRNAKEPFCILTGAKESSSINGCWREIIFEGDFVRQKVTHAKIIVYVSQFVSMQLNTCKKWFLFWWVVEGEHIILSRDRFVDASESRDLDISMQCKNLKIQT